MEKLQLSTQKQPDTVEIDGKPYTLLVYEELTLLQTTRLRRWTARHIEISTKPAADLTEAEAIEADKIVDDTCREILPDCPQEVIAKLSRKSKTQLTTFFFQRLASANSEKKTDGQPAASQGSTEATPPNG